MAIRVFLSCVSAEFLSYRLLLTQQLATVGVKDVRVQEWFKDRGGMLLSHLDDDVSRVDYVVHVVGDGVGNRPKPVEVKALLAKYPDLSRKVGWEAADGAPQVSPPVKPQELSYTQWEFWLGLYHDKECLVYPVDREARREERFRRSPEEEMAQADHLNRIRSLGHSRAAKVSGKWELAARVVVSVLGHPDAAGPAGAAAPPPAIVLGLTRAPAGHYLNAGVRLPGGEFVRLDDAVLVDVNDRKSLTDRLTALTHRGIEALPVDKTGAHQLVLELVLSADLLCDPLDRWCIHEAAPFARQTVPLRSLFPLRLRLADRPAFTSRSLQTRLELLRQNESCVTLVCRRIPDDHRRQSPPPVAVVHDDEQSQGWWEHHGAVCGAFTRPPRAARRRTGRRTPSARSPLANALYHGVPFLVWPERDAVAAEDVESHLAKSKWLERLCYYFRSQKPAYAVLAESRDRPFPEAPPMVSDVAAAPEVP